MPAGGGDARDLTPGDFDSPPTQQEDEAVTFTPDGRDLVFVSNREGADREAWSTNSDVWSVPVSGGTPTKLTTNPAGDAQPVVHARRQVHDRPRAATSRIRIGSLVSRRLRSIERTAAHACSRPRICRSANSA